jgi:nitric oxide dioxygenase
LNPASGYGVTAEHYESVGKALLATLEEGLGASWTAAAAEAWAELYRKLSAVMQRAAREASSGTPAISAIG